MQYLKKIDGRQQPMTVVLCICFVDGSQSPYRGYERTTSRLACEREERTTTMISKKNRILYVPVRYEYYNIMNPSCYPYYT
mmetsp:Transcript_15734/g.34035  ORF Transcript_15734/g.34035 Transcript_15734/m.34035 type:complete len:81 (+) Transcript_15734:249-491(+)